MTQTGSQTYSEIYVTVSPKGARYSRLSHGAGRLVQISKADAEASFAAGATVYRKTPGSAWLLAETVNG